MRGDDGGAARRAPSPPFVSSGRRVTWGVPRGPGTGSEPSHPAVLVSVFVASPFRDTCSVRAAWPCRVAANVAMLPS